MKTEQKWIIGNSIDWLPKLLDNSVDLVVTDPPYNIGFNYKGGYSDKLSEEDYVELLNNFERMPAVFIHYPEETIKYLIPALGIPDKLVAWVYNSNTNRQFRLISWFNCKPDFSRIKQPYKNLKDKRIKELIANGSEGTKLYDWWFINQVKNVSCEKTEHPCQIPLEIYENIIKLTTEEGDLVLDPFLGSGTALEACRNTNRNCLGIEIDPQWEPIYRKRLKLDNTKLDAFNTNAEPKSKSPL